MNNDAKKMLSKLYKVREKYAKGSFSTHPENDLIEIEKIANIQTAITGILEEELLELKLWQAKEDIKTMGRYFQH